MAELINNSANYWKHSSEWILTEDESINDKLKKILENHQKTTLGLIVNLGINTSEPYLLANVLCEILTLHPPRFENLIPFLKQWRDEVRKL